MNQELKDLIRDLGFKQFEVARKIGVSEFTFCSWLRRELTEAQQTQIKKALSALKAERIAKLKDMAIDF